MKKLFDFLKTINIQIDIDVKNTKDSEKYLPIQGVLDKIMANDRITIFIKININQMFGQYLKKSDKINRLWKDFFNIYEYICGSNVDSTEVKDKTRKWHTDFLNLYLCKHVTPYMHAFVNHLYQFFERGENLHLFSGVGLEKLNDLSKNDYFSGTNRKEFTKQMLLKRCRINRYDALNADKE